MLLKRPPLNKQKANEAGKGIYMPKEKRLETRNEIARAHF
jgi:hypothetical protein